MSVIVAGIVGIIAFVLGEWRYGVMALTVAVASFFNDGLSDHRRRRPYQYPGWWTIIFAATLIGIAAWHDRYLPVAIVAGLIAVAAIYLSYGKMWQKAGQAGAAGAVAVVLFASFKMVTVMVAIPIVLALIVWAMPGQGKTEWGCMPLVGIIIVVAAVFGLWHVADARDRSANVKRYGQAVFDLCKSPETLPTGGATVSGGKVLFVESGKNNRGQVLDSYFDRIPDKYQAHKKSDLAEVVCISASKEVYGTGSYTNGTICTRYQRTVTAYLVNVNTGSVISSQDFFGSTPKSCPSSTSQSGTITETGKAPSSKKIADWVLSSIRG